jgi:hypothetical protein
MKEFLSEPSISEHVKTTTHIIREKTKDLPIIEKAKYLYHLEENLFNSMYKFPLPSSILQCGIALVARISIGTWSSAACLKNFPPIKQLAEEELQASLEKYKNLIPGYDPSTLTGVLTDFPEQSRYEKSSKNNDYYKKIEEIKRELLLKLPEEVHVKIKNLIDVKRIDYKDEQSMEERYEEILSKVFRRDKIGKTFTKASTALLILWLKLGNARKIIESYIPPKENLLMPIELPEITYPLYDIL